MKGVSLVCFKKLGIKNKRNYQLLKGIRQFFKKLSKIYIIGFKFENYLWIKQKLIKFKRRSELEDGVESNRKETRNEKIVDNMKDLKIWNIK